MPSSVLGDVFEASRYRSDESLVFAHPQLGTPLDPSKLSREYMRPALKARRDHETVSAVA